MKHLGVLTGGGDCPGLNAVIRGVVLRAAKEGRRVVGFRRGWQGLLKDGQTTMLDLGDVEEIHALGGTIIGTSRVNPLEVEGGPDQVRQNLARHDCDSLVVIGGEKTLGAALELARQGLPVVGIPKTLDNNVAATDYTFGFLTGVNTTTDAIDRLVTTAKSHGRVLVVEVMGRNSGWLALYAGLGGGAHQVLIPERPFDVGDVCDKVKQRHERGAEFSVIVVSEGARPADPASLPETRPPTGDGSEDGIARLLAQAIANRTGLETRSVALGPLQRGGSPTGFDRVLGLRLGYRAADLAIAGRFGMMTSLRGTAVVDVPLEEALKRPKTVDDEFFQAVSEVFG